jgi:thioredoxin reductase
VAELTSDRPFHPGEYPVVVVGSGPGGLQASYCLSRLGVDHAVLSRDEEPGGMFRQCPIYQRLLSWTKPDAPFEAGTREFEWFDHNSLVAEEPESQATVIPFMDRSYMVPSRPEMEKGLASFTEKAGVRVRYGCAWEGTRREADGKLVLVTSDGEYRCKAAVFALGVTEPWKSPIPGIDAVPHYVEAERPQTYQGKRVFVIGKRNSGFELADGLLPWAKQVFLGSPRPVDTSVIALSTVRVRYLQPYEDAGLGGGTFALDVALERIERKARGYRIVGAGTTREGQLDVEVDEVIAATGFGTPLRDLGDQCGVRTVAQGRIPTMTPYWESDGGSGIYFAGNATQGAAGLRKHGVGASSAAVHGFRYNARVMARHLAATHLGKRPALDRVTGDLAEYLLGEATRAPELWAQKSYLARVVFENGETDILPLADFLDHPPHRAVAIAVEMNAEGDIYPAVYATNGDEDEYLLPPHPLNDFTGEEYQRELRSHLQRS